MNNYSTEPVSYTFHSPELCDFMGNIRREWVMTNGIGGYSGSSIIGAHNRTHQGYLIAGLHPPVERYLVFSKINEKIYQDGVCHDFETSMHAPDTICHGNQYLTEFFYDGTVRFTYQTNYITMKKILSPVHGENTVAIAYEFSNSGEDAKLILTPLMNYREHSENSTPDSLCFRVDPLPAAAGFSLIPRRNPKVRITLTASTGKLTPREQLYDRDMMLQTEIDNEARGLDCHFTPYDIEVHIPAHTDDLRLSVICQVTDSEICFPESVPFCSLTSESAFHIAATEQARLHSFVNEAGYHDQFARMLVLASSQFYSLRQSTGLTTILAGLPWFTDWGRDTMIAFTGLTLATGHIREAEEILLTFAKYVRQGLIPNMFPDDGQEPLYNTADASLWYFYAVYQYLQYTGTAESYTFIRNHIFPKLLEILDAYQYGTDYSIYMEEDGLIHAGSGLDQVTWMDVRIGDWVATPRHGKPVEINALWYNALRITEELCRHYAMDASRFEALADRVKCSFSHTFWYEKGGYLYDVVDNDMKDASLRPNQIYAVSLPFSLLSPEQEAAVVRKVQENLYAKTGLRSLAPSHPDYHPIYQGSLDKRDHAYHQGTSWGYLSGGFLTAYMKVHGYTPEAASEAMRLLEPVILHMCREGCIGSISEIFDGDAPHHSRGCYAQAWSVGEILRCYTQDILPYLPDNFHTQPCT